MFGQPLQRFDEVDSTNRVALDWEDAPHGAAVVAASQTSGRGRLGRQWSSPAGAGLYLSVVLHSQELENKGAVPLMVALAVAQAIEKLGRLKVCVKWPNDILHVRRDGAARKIGGILCEGRGNRTIAGIGLNLNQSQEELPSRPIFEASSLLIETKENWDVDTVLQAVLLEMEQVVEKGWLASYREFVRHCYGLGEVVRVSAPDSKVIGIFEAVREDGALMLRTPEGLRPVLAGDVTYL